MYGEDATQAAHYVFGTKSSNKDTTICHKLDHQTLSPIKQETKSEETLPHYQLFENKVIEKVRKFYSGKFVVSKRTFTNQDGKKCIPDITVEGYGVFDVKSGAISMKELVKLIEYGKLAQVKAKGLILSNMKTLSPSHKKFCSDNQIHVIFEETLEEGLESILKSPDQPLIQAYPSNHVSQVSIEAIDQEHLDRFLTAVQKLPNNITGDVCPKFWPRRVEIITLYRKYRGNGWTKTKCCAEIKVDCNIPNSSATLQRFIDLFFNNMAEYYRRE